MIKQRKPKGQAAEATFEPPRVVVRFCEGVRGADPLNMEEQIAGIGPWKRLVDKFPTSG